MCNLASFPLTRCLMYGVSDPVNCKALDSQGRGISFSPSLYYCFLSTGFYFFYNGLAALLLLLWPSKEPTFENSTESLFFFPLFSLTHIPEQVTYCMSERKIIELFSSCFISDESRNWECICLCYDSLRTKVRGINRIVSLYHCIYYLLTQR